MPGKDIPIRLAVNAGEVKLLIGVTTAVKTRAPVLAGNFAVWSGLFNAFDCSFHAFREKEDAWNSVVAGAATGGLLSVRAGPTAMLVSAAFGGIFLGVIEGVGVVWARVQGQGAGIDPQPYPEAQHAEPKHSAPASPFKGHFGFQ